jgi:hypothetical protein
VTVFVKHDAAISPALDDTLFGRSSREVFGAHYLQTARSPRSPGSAPVGELLGHRRHTRRERRNRAGHGHRPGRVRADRARPRANQTVAHAVSRPAGEGDPDPQPQPHRRVRRHAHRDRTTAVAAVSIAHYNSHWTIKTAHQEAKAHCIEQAGNLVQKAVEHTVPSGFLTQTITITWYAVHGEPRDRPPTATLPVALVPPEATVS